MNNKPMGRLIVEIHKEGPSIILSFDDYTIEGETGESMCWDPISKFQAESMISYLKGTYLAIKQHIAFLIDMSGGK